MLISNLGKLSLNCDRAALAGQITLHVPSVPVHKSEFLLISLSFLITLAHFRTVTSSSIEAGEARRFIEKAHGRSLVVVVVAVTR